MKIKLISLLTILTFSIATHGQGSSLPINETQKVKAALSFINDYVNHCQDGKSESETITWVENNKLLTSEFKKSYKKLIQEARIREPELGLGFDPIFDAQDYPEKGFVFLKIENEDYVTVSGKDWTAFTTIIKVRLIEGHWMVDGAGIVNVPQDKQRIK